MLFVQKKTTLCATLCARLMAAGVLEQINVFPVRNTAEEGHVWTIASS